MNLSANENWDAAQQRFLAFWHREVIDRPMLQMDIPRRDGGTSYLAEAFPITYLQRGGLAAMMGCAQNKASGTVWTHPIDCELDTLDIHIDRSNAVLREMIDASTHAAGEVAGRAMVSFPADMGNVGDTLAKMRGYTNLCLDLAADIELVTAREQQVTVCWRLLYEMFYSLTQPFIPGSCTQWLPIYAPGRCTLIEADFAALVSPHHFAAVYLPAVLARVDAVEQSIFHLDGPGMIRHLDILLEIPRLDGIQWEPGAGSGSRLQWMPLLQKIQRAGKCLWVACEVNEVEQMITNLSPNGLILSILGCDSLETARGIERLAMRL